MIKKLKNYILICLILALPASVFGGKGAGSSSYEFLNIPVGSRETAMGSGTAVAHGSNAFWWNPAGLAYLERSCLSLAYNRWFEGITQQRAGYSFVIPGIGRSAGAFNISMLSAGGIEGYDWFDVSTGEVPFKDYSLSYTQAKAFKNYFLAGITLKTIFEQLGERDSSFGGTVDLGILLNPVGEFWMSAGVRNLGVATEFDRRKENLPCMFFGGLGLRLNKSILVSSDIMYLEQEIKYGAGFEFDVWDMIFLRAGWNDFSDSGENFRAGAGWKWKDFSIDYVYVPYGKLGNTHRLDLNLKFGRLPLIENLYREGIRLYKNKKYAESWIEFNKVKLFNSDYKKIDIWLEKVKKKVEDIPDIELPEEDETEKSQDLREDEHIEQE